MLGHRCADVRHHPMTQRANSFDSRTIDKRVDVGQGDRAALDESGRHRHRTRGFHPDDTNLRALCTQIRHHACERPTTADGYHHQVRGDTELLDDLLGDGALTCGRASVVKRVDPRRTGLEHIGLRSRSRGIVGVPDRDQFDEIASMPTDTVTLLLRRVGGDVDPTVDLHRARCVGDALGVVARARRHHTGRTLGLGQKRHHVVGSADLVRTDRLQIFTLEVDLCARIRRQTLAELQRGRHHHGADSLRRRLDRIGVEVGRGGVRSRISGVSCGHVPYGLTELPADCSAGWSSNTGICRSVLF